MKLLIFLGLIIANFAWQYFIDCHWGEALKIRGIIYLTPEI